MRTLLFLPLSTLCLVPAASQPSPQRAAVGKPQSSWGRALNPTGRMPKSGFRAIYFDRRDPSRVVFAEDVPSVAIRYIYRDFHGINSPDFGAYWVGQVDFRKTVTKEISVSQSWAKSRILIDGKIVFDGGSQQRFTHEFGAGKHVIEVEHVNNWHTVEFKMTLGDAVRPIDVADVPAAIGRHLRGPTDLFYAGIYESKAKDTHVNLVLPKSDRPAILWLTSYEAVDWIVASPNRVSAVIVGSYSPGTRVGGVRRDRVHYVKEWRGLYDVTRRCGCLASTFHCEGQEDLNGLAQRLTQATDLNLSAYAVSYAADALTLKPYDTTAVATIDRQRQTDATTERQCTRQANPNFDKMFDEKR